MQLGLDMCQALKTIHAIGVIHRSKSLHADMKMQVSK